MAPIVSNISSEFSFYLFFHRLLKYYSLEPWPAFLLNYIFVFLCLGSEIWGHKTSGSTDVQYHRTARTSKFQNNTRHHGNVCTFSCDIMLMYFQDIFNDAWPHAFRDSTVRLCIHWRCVGLWTRRSCWQLVFRLLSSRWASIRERQAWWIHSVRQRGCFNILPVCAHVYLATLTIQSER